MLVASKALAKQSLVALEMTESRNSAKNYEFRRRVRLDHIENIEARAAAIIGVIHLGRYDQELADKHKEAA